jgi:hypothetical protein
MKKANLLLTFAILFMANAFGQDQKTLNEFETLCDQMGLEFNMPNGYAISKVHKNRDLAYEFAIINEDSTMEVRYSFWSLEEDLIAYEESLKDSNITMINPNNIYKGRIQANVLNMTGGVMYNIGPFPDQAVKKEFNADKGGSCFFEFNCEFGKGYTYGQFIYLHKDNVADVIVTFMSNDKNTHSDLMMEGFHSMIFKAENKELISDAALHKGLKFMESENTFFLANKFGYKVSKFDAVTFSTDEIIKLLRDSDIADRELIARVLEMQSKEARIREIVNLAKTYKDFSTTIIDYLHGELETRLGKEQLNQLKEKQVE